MANPVPPLPPLSTIQDPAVQAYLKALTDGWNIRNGNSGDGTAAFITAGDLGTSLTANATGATSIPQSSMTPITAAVSAALTKLSDAIQQSRLWKLLDQTLGTIQNNVASVTTEVSTIQGSDGSGAQSLTTLRTNAAGISATATNAFSLATTINGDIAAAWTVKVDANGYVSGFGLGIDGHAGTATSQFIVRADQFAIGSPGGAVATTSPFTVLTTSATVGGYTFYPGIYMNAPLYGTTGTFAGSLAAATGTFAGALSAATGTFSGSLSAATGTFAGALSAATGTFSGSLTAAAVNAVNTINLAGNAVTVPVYAYTAGGGVGYPTYYPGGNVAGDLLTGYVDASGGSVTIFAKAYVGIGYTLPGCAVQLVAPSGTVIHTFNMPYVMDSGGNPTTIPDIAICNCSESGTYRIRVLQASYWYPGECMMFLLGTKR